jgi:C_GCAxxG_C_C family probable redox protein
MLAVGEYLLGYVDYWMQRMTTGLAGGVGCSHQEMCGALSGGVLLIGAVHGRTKPTEDDRECQRLAAEYRERFARELGATLCRDLQANGYGSNEEMPCSMLVEQAARILLQVLAIEDEFENTQERCSDVQNNGRQASNH